MCYSDNLMMDLLSYTGGISMTAGSRSTRWDGKDDAGAAVSSGVYLYRISAGGFLDVKKMVLTH